MFGPADVRLVRPSEGFADLSKATFKLLTNEPLKSVALVTLNNNAEPAGSTDWPSIKLASYHPQIGTASE